MMKRLFPSVVFLSVFCAGCFGDPAPPPAQEDVVTPKKADILDSLPLDVGHDGGEAALDAPGESDMGQAPVLDGSAETGDGVSEGADVEVGGTAVADGADTIDSGIVCDDGLLVGVDDQVGDGVDQNCDGVDGLDEDGDGFASLSSGGTDCDDKTEGVNPQAPDLVGNSKDDNCDGIDGVDGDQDGHASKSSGGDDCNDKDSSIHPGAPDMMGDGADRNCDGMDGVDFDGDGYGSEASGGTDCNDYDEDIHPGVPDAEGDSLDKNCDGHDGVDKDGDGYGAKANGGKDCDDNNSNINPGVDDPLGDLFDSNCDGHDGVDNDGDGHASIQSGGGDCDDDASGTYPGAADPGGVGGDSNCDGVDGVDADGDGYASVASGGKDPNDNNSSVKPPSNWEVAKHWAPVFYHDTDDEHYEADYIVAVNFDGDYISENNWENLDAAGVDLGAVIYFSVYETKTHWFVLYLDFHPRDWAKDCSPLWCLGLLCEPCHENDMEGAMVVVRKDATTYGKFELLYTEAHNTLHAFTNNSQITEASHHGIEDVGVTFEDGSHPELYVESKGHGVCALYFDGDEHGVDHCKHDVSSIPPEFGGGDGVVYRYKGYKETPSSGNDSDVSYTLRSAEAALWSRRYEICDDGCIFDKPMVYAGETIGGAFDGEDYGDDKAMPPWAWDDPDDGAVYKGDFFFDPAHTLDTHFHIPGGVSKDYLYNHYLK